MCIRDSVKHFADLVLPQHRLQKSEIVQLWKTVLEMDKRIKDPRDDLIEISRKITAWKRKAGDIDQQA